MILVIHFLFKSSRLFGNERLIGGIVVESFSICMEIEVGVLLTPVAALIGQQKRISKSSHCFDFCSSFTHMNLRYVVKIINANDY